MVSTRIGTVLICVESTNENLFRVGKKYKVHEGLAGKPFIYTNERFSYYCFDTSMDFFFDIVRLARIK